MERAATAHIAETDPIVARTLRLMRENLEELSGIDELARRCHVSRATLLRRFKEHRRLSPSEELRQLRLQRARDLMEQTQMPLAEVAVAAGFGPQSALNRAIRSALNCTPGELRQRRGRTTS